MTKRKRKTIKEMLAERSTTPEKIGWKPSIFDPVDAAEMMARVRRKIERGHITGDKKGGRRR
jgi:hypothetical protein